MNYTREGGNVLKVSHQQCKTKLQYLCKCRAIQLKLISLLNIATDRYYT